MQVLLETLAEPGRYVIQSTHDLAASVGKELFDRTGIDADIRPVPELLPLSMRDKARPLELLLALDGFILWSRWGYGIDRTTDMHPRPPHRPSSTPRKPVPITDNQ